MIDRQHLNGPRYLISAIGFSSIPRLITSVLTLLSFPLVVRAVGASIYGVFVYVNALLSVVVVLADFGVAAAAGKAIAEARPRGPTATRQTLLRCVRLQALVGTLGLIPVVAISWTIVRTSSAIAVEPTFLFTMIIAIWIAVATAFIRYCLTSFLAFGWLALLDSVESSVRAAGWLLVAWVAPTGMGLALSTLVPSVVAAVLGGAILYTKSRESAFNGETGDTVASQAPDSYRKLFADSVRFFGLGLATRVFLSTPYIIFGRWIGAEVVGVVGAFTRLLDMISLPFAILGNALAVRAHEIKTAGREAAVALWDACFRFVVIAAGAMGVFLLASDISARALIPDSPSAPALFAILSVVVLTHSTSCFVSPMADFAGGLKDRVVFLWALALVQIPVLLVAVYAWSQRGGVSAYALVNVVMIYGYIVIAKRALLHEAPYSLPRYVVLSFIVIASSLAASLILKAGISWNGERTSLDLFFLIPVLAYVGAICAAFIGLKRLRARFLTLAVFEFTSDSRRNGNQ